MSPEVRPHVLCNMATSLDGKVSPVRRSGSFVMSRHCEDPRRMRELRQRADAVLIGTGNLVADDPDLAPSRLRVVVTRGGDRIVPTVKMFDPALGGEAVVAHTATMSEPKAASLRDRATLVNLGETEVNISRLLRWLAEERGCRVVLCEGGGVLIASLMAARAVDEFYLTVVPRVLGGVGALTVVEGPGFETGAIPDARLTSLDRVGDELFLRYEFSWT
jgi:diaminohydroxyphosphoribosylaminopyrimidine deaminase/5-amino-6-(5-phosphoribosylamino)uracil reductase